MPSFPSVDDLVAALEELAGQASGPALPAPQKTKITFRVGKDAPPPPLLEEEWPLRPPSPIPLLPATETSGVGGDTPTSRKRSASFGEEPPSKRRY